MGLKIALIGNPNSGKTTMFNELTGSSQYVGNWPGVTVEKKEGRLKGHNDVIVTDLPGIYSLSPHTPEEVVSRNFLLQESPDVIINTVDASNLERNLYLTTQLLELRLPVLIVLNMMDVVEKRNLVINKEKLSAALGCQIVEASAIKGEGCSQAAEMAISIANEYTSSNIDIQFKLPYSQNIENALSEISGLIKNTAEDRFLQFYSVKLYERDKDIENRVKLSSEAKERIEEIINECEKQFDDDSESIVINERYVYISQIVKDCMLQGEAKAGISEKIDSVVTNKFLAIPIFAAIMFFIYFMAITIVGSIVDMGDVEAQIAVYTESLLTSLNVAPMVVSLIVDGFIGGVGAVLGFLPQMAVLFFLLAILEDCGYMSRIAFILDKIFLSFGLSGKSFIPILIGTGCGVPGILASRTIENERDRKITIITTTFIPCSAKLPVIALISGTFFQNSLWVAPSAYFIGIAAIVFSGIILKKTKAFASENAPFIMELPAYHLPRMKNVMLQVWDRVKAFIKKAGTVIFLACGVVWLLSSFNIRFEPVEEAESMLASLGGAIAWVFSPLGFGDWKASVATLTGIIAKENVVGTFGVFDLGTSFTALSAYSFLLFNLLCAPCVAAIGAIRQEMGSAKWTLYAVLYQTGFAYFVAFVVYRLGLAVNNFVLDLETVLAFILIAGFIYLVVRPASRSKKDSAFPAHINL